MRGARAQRNGAAWHSGSGTPKARTPTPMIHLLLGLTGAAELGHVPLLLLLQVRHRLLLGSFLGAAGRRRDRVHYRSPAAAELRAGAGPILVSGADDHPARNLGGRLSGRHGGRFHRGGSADIRAAAHLPGRRPWLRQAGHLVGVDGADPYHRRAAAGVLRVVELGARLPDLAVLPRENLEGAELLHGLGEDGDEVGSLVRHGLDYGLGRLVHPQQAVDGEGHLLLQHQAEVAPVHVVGRGGVHGDGARVLAVAGVADLLLERLVDGRGVGLDEEAPADADAVAAAQHRDHLLRVEALLVELVDELGHRDVRARQVVGVLAVGHERVAPPQEHRVFGPSRQLHRVAGAHRDDVRARHHVGALLLQLRLDLLDHVVALDGDVGARLLLGGLVRHGVDQDGRVAALDGDTHNTDTVTRCMHCMLPLVYQQRAYDESTTAAATKSFTYVCEAVVEDEAEEAGGGAGVRLEPLLDDAQDDLLGVGARRLVEICRELRGDQRRERRGHEGEEEAEAETGVHHARRDERRARCDARARPGHAYTDGRQPPREAERWTRLERDERLSLAV
jgi:hypothetical protein